MRIALTLIALATVFAAPAYAGDKVIFGSSTCTNVIPCSGDTAFYSATASIIRTTNQCVTDGFGYQNASGFFDEISGMDVDNCLTAKLDVIPKGPGARLTPHCCVTKLQNNTCHMHCDLLTQ